MAADSKPADGDRETGDSAATRRDFLRLFAALGLGPWLAPACVGAGAQKSSTRPPAALDPPVPVPARPDGLRSPAVTGSLDDAELDDLWTIFAHIDDTWDNQCTIDTRAAFQAIIDLKTARTPSYLTEYRSAVAKFRALRTEYEQPRALHRLFFGQDDPHIHHHVIAELLRLHVVHGGFRAFGYANYKGFPGGPFADREKPPYRILAGPAGER